MRAAEAPDPEPVGKEAPAAAEPKPEGSGVDVANLSPLARWAYERSQQTGFVESAIAGTPALRVEQAAEHVEEVLSSDAVPSGRSPRAGSSSRPR